MHRQQINEVEMSIIRALIKDLDKLTKYSIRLTNMHDGLSEYLNGKGKTNYDSADVIKIIKNTMARSWSNINPRCLQFFNPKESYPVGFKNLYDAIDEEIKTTNNSCLFSKVKDLVRATVGRIDNSTTDAQSARFSKSMPLSGGSSRASTARRPTDVGGQANGFLSRAGGLSIYFWQQDDGAAYNSDSDSDSDDIFLEQVASGNHKKRTNWGGGRSGRRG